MSMTRSRLRPQRPGPPERYLGKPCTWCDEPVEDPEQLTLVLVHPASGWEVLHGWCAEERSEAEMSKLLGGR